ncbi:copper resistance CopC/CopD family protein [Neobacillus vireti]|uniref:copper resistance CopC/CopD family protein n=1 Tax=Neobacillus vireti TaxID=220686 RepID=UPI002FFF26E8
MVAINRGRAVLKSVYFGSLLFTALCLFLFIYPSFAAAHAYIIKSTPSENEILNEAPKKVSIQFDETIQPSFNSIEVFDSAGKRVDQKNGRVNASNPSIIESDLNEDLSNGTYSIKWRVVSSDGHPVEGVIPFQIGNGDTEDSSTIDNESKGYTPQFDLIIIRWLQYVSNALFVGILFFYLFVLNKQLTQEVSVKDILSKLLQFSFITLCISIILSLPLQATIESGSSWSKILNLQVLREFILNSTFGELWFIQIIGLFVLSITSFLLIKNKFKPILVWISFILGIGLLLSKAFTSHAASSSNVILTITLDFLHLLAASVWIGSLFVLVSLVPLSRKIGAKELFFDSIKKFSKWGIILVILLTLTGFIASLSYIPNLRALLFTDYGRVLSGKILLLVLMIAFAAVNLVKGKRHREKGLASSLWGELITGIIVLVLSVLLTNLPTAMSSPGPFKETRSITGSKLTFEATPNVIGKNTFAVSLRDQKGEPMKDIEQVTLTFTSLEMDMGNDTKTLIKVQDGKYESKGMNFNMAGRWNVHVHVLTKDLDTLDTDYKVLVGSQ